MSAAAGAGTARDDVRVPWGDVLMSAVAAVSWALIGMAGTAALGLRLLEADTAGSLGPMTAAVVALGAGGSVTPSGEVSAFGLTGAEADTAIEITPLGVSLVGAVLLSWFFLRSLRAAGVVISRAELLARAGAVVALFVAMLGGLAWAGHDVITIDGGSLGLDDVTGGSGGVEIPGLGDVGGLLPDRLGDLVDAQASVGFTVDTAPTLLGGFGWSAGILLVALLASRRTPLPRGWEAVHRVVRPAVSAVVTVLLVAVAAGFAAAAYAATGDDRPERIAGAALLGAPNGVWLGIPLGLFVPWDGRATGELIRFLPDPLDDLLGAGSEGPVTLGRLAELDGRVWLLAVAAGLMMLLAGVLTGVRTPVGAEHGALRFAGWCALRLGAATALALPLLAWLTDVSVTASLSVLGFDAFGGGIELHGHLGPALLLGAVWGAGAGAVGALLAWACGAAGRRATASARGEGLTLGEDLALADGAAGPPGAGWPGGGPWPEGRHAEHGTGAGAGPVAPWGGRGPSGYDESAGQGWSGGGAGHAAGGGQGSVRYGGGGEGPVRYDGGGEQAWPGAAGTGRPGDDAGSGQGPVRYGGGGEQAWPGAAGTGRTGDDAGGGQGQTWGGPGPAEPDRDARQARPGAGTRRPGEDAGTGQARTWGGPGQPEDTPRAGQAQPQGGPEPAGHHPGRGQAWPGAGAPRPGGDAEAGPGGDRYDAGAGAGRPEGGVRGGEAGPYAPGTPYRPPNPGTNPYLRVPDGLREPEEPQDAGPPGVGPPSDAEDDAPADDDGPPAPGDVYGAPTVVRPVGPPPRGPRQAPGPRNGNGPPPPPPPPPPPRQPRGGR
ncbi:streptophobe family protein [Streptomyces paradoxus]|uniref:streptophobe family protein n=1 Tax=Streptomyces paradoxus TaxID=66375 RepID=UPI0037CCD15A